MAISHGEAQISPTIVEVNQALNLLYCNRDSVTSEEKETASRWLESFQCSVYAWKLCDSLLIDSENHYQSYFAAQTLRTKVQRSFSQLPADAYESLSNSLMQHLLRSYEHKPTYTQLSLALVDLLLQMPIWRDPVKLFIENFSSSPHLLSILLELLTVLPEEVSSRNVSLGGFKRHEISKQLACSSSIVTNLLSALLNQFGQSEDVCSNAFKCLKSWFEVNALDQADMSQSTLMQALILSLQQPNCSSNLHESATDCLCQALYSCGDDYMKNKQLVDSLRTAIYELEPSYHLSVAHEDVDKASNYARIFTELSETITDVLVKEKQETPSKPLKELDLLLTTVGHCEYEVAEISCNMWYRLFELLYDIDKEEVTVLFKPYFERLIEGLTKHVELDNDMLKPLDPREELADFRSRVTDLIVDISDIVDPYTTISNMLRRVHALPLNQTNWQEIEAALFIISAVINLVNVEDNKVVPQVLQYVLSVNSGNLCLRYTSSIIVGGLSHWMAFHPDCVAACINYLSSGLSDKQLAEMSANGLYLICAGAPNAARKHFDELILLSEHLDDYNFSSDTQIDLLKAVCNLLSKSDIDDVKNYVNKLVSYQLAPLTEYLNLPNKDKDPALWLDRLATIFKFTQRKELPHPCLDSVFAAWPIVSRAFQVLLASERMIERCCRVVRFMIRCVTTGIEPLLSDIVGMIVSAYTAQGHSCCLYLASILLDAFGDDVKFHGGLLQMLNALSMPAVENLAKDDALRQNPDTVDDLFRMLTRAIQHCKLVFIQMCGRETLLQCGVYAVMLDHKEANTSVTKFWTCLARASSSDPEMLEVLMSKAFALLTAMFDAIIFHLPSYMTIDIADVIFEMLSADHDRTMKYFSEAVYSLKRTNDSGHVVITDDLIEKFKLSVSQSRALDSVAHACRDFVKLYK